MLDRRQMYEQEEKRRTDDHSWCRIELALGGALLIIAGVTGAVVNRILNWNAYHPREGHLPWAEFNCSEFLVSSTKDPASQASGLLRNWCHTIDRPKKAT